MRTLPQDKQIWAITFVFAIACLVLFRAYSRRVPLPPRSHPPSPLVKLSSNTVAVPRSPALALSVPQQSASALAAEEVVKAKVARFGQSRHRLAESLARKHGVELTSEVEDFFLAVESGDWDEIEDRFQLINGGDSSAGHASGRPPEVVPIWPAIIDAYGAAEQAHLLPAENLLKYGQTILDSLKPGMIYVGGTDSGRWVPELLNETSDGERHIILTQNGLADATYLDYVQLQYEGQISTLSLEDSQRSFQEYVADARNRLDHDQKFPSEPKQVRPGEEIHVVDNQVNVSGQVAVMSINEKLLQTLMDKNPDRSFGLQESFPLKSTYPSALPIGPIMELGAADAESSFNRVRATETLAFWQDQSQALLSDPVTQASPASLKTYSHDIASAANLLAFHNFADEAEQAYHLASQLWPGNPEPVAALAGLLGQSGRVEEARQTVADFTQRYPDQWNALERAGVDKSVLWHSKP